MRRFFFETARRLALACNCSLYLVYHTPMSIARKTPTGSQLEKWREKHPYPKHTPTEKLRRVYKKDKQKFVDDYKAERGCAKCPVKDPRILVFHHLDPDGKDGTISRMIGSRRSLDVIKAEIAKCQVLCHNCHVLTHWEMRHEVSN